MIVVVLVHNKKEKNIFNFLNDGGVNKIFKKLSENKINIIKKNDNWIFIKFYKSYKKIKVKDIKNQMLSILTPYDLEINDVFIIKDDVNNTNIFHIITKYETTNSIPIIQKIK